MAGVKRVLITGMSGTGKSTVIKELAARGYKAVDADYNGLSELVSIPASSDRSGLGAQQDWIWREDRIADLLSTEDADVLFLSGTASNQVKFYGRFDHIVLLTAPASVMTERLVRRTNNPYGKDPNDLARALALKQTVEPLLRRGADLEIDTSVPIDEVVERLLDVVLR
jgi:dephospho-CoA kinase